MALPYRFSLSWIRYGEKNGLTDPVSVFVEEVDGGLGDDVRHEAPVVGRLVQERMLGGESDDRTVAGSWSGDESVNGYWSGFGGKNGIEVRENYFQSGVLTRIDITL